MPDGVASLASFAFHHSWEAHDRVPRALISYAMTKFETVGRHAALTCTSRLVVYMQTHGHYVIGFGGCLRGNIVSFALVVIQLYVASTSREDDTYDSIVSFIFDDR